MSDSIFIADGDRVIATKQARGPWDPLMLHGGAPAALITSAFERLQPGVELHLARLGFEFLRPIPSGPLTLSTRVVRPGRRVQELAAELHADDELVVRASALRVQVVPPAAAELAPTGERDLGGRAAGRRTARQRAAGQRAAGEDPDGNGTDRARMAPPSAARPTRFALDGSDDASFAGSAMEMRWLDDPLALGPGRVWMRLRYPLLPGEPLTPLARLAATADFGNGVSALLPFDRFVFINADLHIHLQRQPEGEWIGLDARTLLVAHGTGLSESVLHDEHGAIGRAFQTLVVQPR